MKHEIKYYSNGKKHRESYHNISHQYHNEFGPAIIYYYENGNKRSEIYCINDKRHNEFGPGYIFYNENGKIKHKEYYLNDKEIHVKTDKEFQKYIKLLNIS